MTGAIRTPQRRTVAAALRALGQHHDRGFSRYHRVLSRARWSGLAVRRTLLQLLVTTFVPPGPVVVGIDETIERRRGSKIAATGSYRDPVRSSHGHFVKASGRRWVCLLLLVPLPWAGRTWALPFLTALAPAARYDQQRGHRHKTLADWARQLLVVVRRWWPDRDLVAVADRSDAVLDLLAACQSWPRPVTVSTRLRLDAALDAPPPLRRPGQRGRPRLKGDRLPTLAARAADARTTWTPLTVAAWYGRGARTVEVVTDTAIWYHRGLPPVPVRWVLIRDPAGTFANQALLCTDLTVSAEQILTWFVRRWQLEVTFAEVRRHRGVECQRQWSDPAIARTTPALLGLFSLVTLLAHPHLRLPHTVPQTAWYAKPLPTFTDALALVRRQVWSSADIPTLLDAPDRVLIPRAWLDHLTDVLCYAA